ncbi:DUF3237 family protein [Amycolatopsis antarctica]|uniref:DUF3237 family protein n=1 Tax=Amycolatopsis antarctica TaxID=1854586 RepID=UPI001F0AADD7|nr:DUF3237 family protein [Amycolatopsis antarctica]
MPVGTAGRVTPIPSSARATTVTRSPGKERPRLRSRPLFTLTAHLAEPHLLDGGPLGDRRVVDIRGGRFDGDRLSGDLLPSGADFQLVRSDGVPELGWLNRILAVGVGRRERAAAVVEVFEIH